MGKYHFGDLEADARMKLKQKKSNV